MSIDPGQPASPYGPAQTVYPQAVRPPSNGMAVAAMVLGIFAITVGVWSLLPFLGFAAAFFSFTPALLAVILGSIGRSRSATLGGLGRGQATAGIVLGAVTLGINVLGTVGSAVLAIFGRISGW